MNHEPPKYMNSPKTELYDKSKILYGLDKFDAKKGGIIIVEGQFDVIAVHGAGSNAVAASGTTFSRHQARMVCRYTNDIALCYDSDEPGQKATERAAQTLQEWSEEFEKMRDSRFPETRQYFYAVLAYRDGLVLGEDVTELERIITDYEVTDDMLREEEHHWKEELKKVYP